MYREDFLANVRKRIDNGEKFYSAAEIAERFKRKSLFPQLILSSPANRALNTALIMSKIWGVGPESLQIHDPLYLADVHLNRARLFPTKQGRQAA